MISVVIPYRNSLPHLQPCLAALSEAVSAYGAAEVILVDNGSTDGSRDIASRYLDRLPGQLVDAPAVHVGEARNAGVARARGDILCFVDSDCVVQRDHLHQVNRALRSGGATAVGRRYVLPRDPHWIESVWVQLHDAATPPKYLPGGNLAIGRSVFAELGGFDPRLPAGEDADLCARLVAAGYDVIPDPRLAVIHLGNPKSLRAFWTQQVWHGTSRHRLSDLPLLATFAYIFGVIVAVGGGVLFGWRPLVVGVAITLAVPAAIVSYRNRTNLRPAPFLPALLLYNIYLAARAAALIMMGVNFLASRVIRGTTTGARE